MAAEYKETVERRYFTITGEKANEETIENLIATGESECFLQKAIQEQGRGRILDTILEIQERHDAVKEIEKNFLELHQVFLDMAALVEAQDHQLNNIESHVAHANSFMKRGIISCRRLGFTRRARGSGCASALCWESFSSSFSLSWHQCCSQSRKNKIKELLALKTQITGIPI